MVRSMLVEPIESSRYRMEVSDRIENGKKIQYLNIQDRVVLSNYRAINEPLAIGTYKELKRLLRSGKTPIFNEKCSELITGGGGVENVSVSSPAIMSVQVYIGDVLVKKSEDQQLWLDVMKQIIDRDMSKDNS